jgi:hypothetical protein
MKKPTKPTSNPDLIEILDQLQAGSIIQQAQIDNLLTLIDFFGNHLHLKELDGRSLRDWFQKEKIDQVERILIHFEDLNPGAAALLQRFVDKKLSKDEPPHNDG